MQADLYNHAWQHHGVPADVVDRQVVWKLAAMLGTDGIDRTPPDDDEGQIPSAGGRDIIAERYAYERGEGPKPEADPTPPMLGLLGPGLIRADA